MRLLNHSHRAAVADGEGKDGGTEAVNNGVESCAVSAPEAVDGLIGVTNADELSVVFQASNCNLKLKRVGVLKLIDKHPAILEEGSAIYDREPEHVVVVDNVPDTSALPEKPHCKLDALAQNGIFGGKGHVVVVEDALVDLRSVRDLDAIDDTANTLVLCEGDELCGKSTVLTDE